MGVQNQLKLKPAALQLIVQYDQLILAKPVRKAQRPYKSKMTGSKSWYKQMVVKSQLKLKPAAVQLYGG